MDNKEWRRVALIFGTGLLNIALLNTFKELAPRVIGGYLIIASIIFAILFFYVFRSIILSHASLSKQIFYYFLYLIFVVQFFGYNFVFLNNTISGSFNIQHSSGDSYIDFMYYSLITFCTVGYGDITPISISAKILTSLEVITGLITLILIISNFAIFFPKNKE